MFTPDEPDDAPMSFRPFKFAATGQGVVTPPVVAESPAVSPDAVPSPDSSED